MAPDIPGAKRAGLPVDLNRLTVEGDAWLSPEERYALKTHGVCTQAQPGVFMIRNRTNGSLDAGVARGLTDIADEFAKGWIRITTRQQVEFHHVHAANVVEVLDRVRDLGLSNQSACGHTMRGVMSCPLAGVGLEEPFDCSHDAKMASDSILQLAPEIDSKMPQRINIAFGGCPDCRDHARVNDMGFVSKISDQGELGYELAADGSTATHPEGRKAIFLGDLVDRGPDTPGVLRLVMGMVADGAAHAVPGNHENKLLRALRGRKVQITHGLAESLAQLEAEPPGFVERAQEFLDGLISHYVLDEGRLVV
ncbi:MAG: metallophosphoesterase, partial [Actinobacteria bacterium]|nr:metallophosphoesterase [Actinomycetota bacterium]